MSPSSRARREVLAGLAVPAVGALAGCDGVLAEGGTPTSESYDDLGGKRVFVADALALSVPQGIDTVDGTDDADAVVLPARTERSAGTAVDWIEGGKRIALVGGTAQDTWLGWQDSEAYADAFDHRGRAESCAGSSSGFGGAGTRTECEPPELLVAWEPAEGPPTTYWKTWGGTDDPTDERVFGGIDDAFEEY